MTEMVPGIEPGSGSVSSTTTVNDIAPGLWDVTAELLGPERARAAVADVRLKRAAWSWSTWALRDIEGPVGTRWAPLALLAASPAVVPGSFTLLAALAILVAIFLEPPFLGLLRVDVGPSILASLAGLIVGLVGAKAWYMLLKGPSRATLKEGWSVDGFLVTAPIVAILVAASRGVPLGGYVDAVAPGLFMAVAIGRIGCFLTGCCAGRPTAGIGIWSSDRRIGMKRIPTQLLESALGLALAVVSATLLVVIGLGGSGVVFLMAVALYAIARQGLLRLRAEARPFSWRRALRPARAQA